MKSLELKVMVSADFINFIDLRNFRLSIYAIKTHIKNSVEKRRDK